MRHTVGVSGMEDNSGIVYGLIEATPRLSFSHTGNGDSGQLGLLSSSNIPVDVSAGESFSALASGGAHVCGLKADASAWCWGT